jgi:hypothetical protein
MFYYIHNSANVHSSSSSIVVVVVVVVVLVVADHSGCAGCISAVH